MSSASPILNAQQLIRQFYRILGKDAPSEINVNDARYAESLLRRYAERSDLIPKIIEKALLENDAKHLVSSISDIKSDIRRVSRKVEISESIDWEFKASQIRSIRLSAPADYRTLARDITQKAISDGLVVEDQLKVLHFEAVAALKEKTKPEDVTSSLSENPAIAKLMACREEQFINEYIEDRIAVLHGLDTEDSFIDSKLDSAGITSADLDKYDSTVAVNQTSSNIALNVSSAVTSKQNMADARSAVVDHAVRDKAAAVIKIEGYKYSPDSKKNYIVFSSPVLKNTPSARLYLNRKGSSYDGTKGFQGDIFDKRFISANPVGTLLVGTLSHVGDNTFSTSFLRSPAGTVKHGLYTLLQVDSHNRERTRVDSRNVAMRWLPRAIPAAQISAHAQKFSKVEEDLIRSKGAWWGFQIREILDNNVAGLSRVYAWNSKAGRSPSYQDLVSMVSKYQDLHKNTGARLEVSLFECMKVIPTLDVFPATADSMLNLPTLLRSNNTSQTQLGGQVMTRGLTEYVNNNVWGATIVSNAKYMDMPTPNMDRADNHIQQHIRDSQNELLELNETIAKSASGISEKKLEVSSPVLAKPKPMSDMTVGERQLRGSINLDMEA